MSKKKRKKREVQHTHLSKFNYTKTSSETEMRLKYIMKRNKTDFITKSKRKNLSHKAIKSEQEHSSVAFLRIYYEFWEYAKQPRRVIKLVSWHAKNFVAKKKGPGKAFILRLSLQGLPQLLAHQGQRLPSEGLFHHLLVKSCIYWQEKKSKMYYDNYSQQ